MTVQAYAKVNLTLEVFAARADGYHGLRSVVMPVSLHDTLEVEDADGISSDTGYPDDLCLKAARVLHDDVSALRGARISVVKRIPAGGGLGGGSADAAATLVALNALWGAGLSIDELVAIGALVGSDVPALVLGGAVLMEGRGERVSRLPGGPFAPLDLVLAAPRVASSTAQVYAECAPRPESSPSATDAMVAALRSGERAAVAAAAANDLQEAAERLHPEIAEARRALLTAGAEAASMSGSGSTVFGFAASEEAAREIAEAVGEMGFWAQAVRTLG